MARKKNTDLQLSNIKKQAKKTHTQEKYELEDGSTITFYPIFPDTMIELMLEELQLHLVTLRQKNITVSEKMNLYLINFMMIKYFTHFKKDIPNHLFTEGKEAGILDWMNDFVDAGLMKIIIDEVFLKDQVVKVHDKLAEFVGATMLITELEEKAQAQFKNMKLKHTDIINKLDGFNVKADIVQ